MITQLESVYKSNPDPHRQPSACASCRKWRCWACRNGIDGYQHERRNPAKKTKPYLFDRRKKR